MHTLRSRLTTFSLAACILAPAVAGAQDEYPQTLYWGSGLIDIPVAWVGPLTGDFALNYSGKNFRPDPNKTKINYSGTINSNLAFSMAFAGRFELGVSAYSGNPEEGFFGRGLLVNEADFSEKTGIGKWLIPSIALGARGSAKLQTLTALSIDEFLGSVS